MQPVFSKQVPLLWLMIAVGLVSLVACTNPTIAAPERNLQESIHYYIYDQQPVSGGAFVAWANANLSQYSTQSVQKALFKEGQRQAKEGHPNGVAALSFADQAWSKEKALTFKRDRWTALQKQATKNIRQTPSGTLQLWPSK